MSHILSVTERNGRRDKVFRTLLLALVIFPTGCKEEKQANETPAQPPAATQSATSVAAVPVSAMPTQTLPVAATPKPLNDLESLVAPIALYPDPLLAELLVAATYPLEVVQAQRWLDTKPDLATLNSKDWDASVMRLTTVPTVIKMMNDHLDWTTQLGDTFLAKPVEVMDSIQALRKRAKDAGFLKDTPEQKVSTQTVSLDQPAETDAVKAVPAVMKKEVISIAPAKADTIYVPQYNPETVYQAPLTAPSTAVATPTNYYPTYYPAPATSTTSSTESMLTFGAGALVGGLLTWGIMEWADDDDDWDDHYHVNHYYGDSVCHNGNCWHGGGYYGDRGNVNVNKDVNISGNEINIDNGGHFNQNNLRPSQRPAGWRPNPKHRRGQAYPEAVQKRLGTFAAVVVLNAPRGDLFVGSGKDLLLHFAHLLLYLLAAAEQIQTRPRQQPGNGIEVRTERLAADTCRFEGDGATTAKAVAHAGRVAEGALAQLLDQFGQTGCRGAQVGGGAYASGGAGGQR